MSMNAMNKHTPEANEFTGKRILVTGGTKGAGKAVADRFNRGGATVIITARSAPTERPDNHFIQADVSTAEGTTKVINEILNRFQGIDIIVNNVGGTSAPSGGFIRSEEHTSELQSRLHLVCRLLLEKKKKKNEKLRNNRNIS